MGTYIPEFHLSCIIFSWSKFCFDGSEMKEKWTNYQDKLRYKNKTAMIFYKKNVKLSFVHFHDLPEQNLNMNQRIHLPLYCVFVCLGLFKFVWLGFYDSLDNCSHGKVTITSERIILFTYARHSWSFSCEGFLVCHNCCDISF